MPKTVRRLYTELKPTNYTLRIVPNFQALTFEGAVTIRLRKTARPSQRLTFHQHGLKITSAEITKHDKKGDRTLEIARINNQDALDEVRIHTNETVYSGDYSVMLHFRGVITKSMTGLYPCYFNLNGEEHVLLATQFESHHARELFPCIDEPEAKATFDLTIVAPKDLTVLANTPIKEQRPADSNTPAAHGNSQKPPATGYQLLATTFETTPKMSTYLLAFVIGELQSKTTQTKRGTEISVWSTIAHPLAALDFALDVAKRSVEFFEHYFGVPYPLPKLDHVGLPDFSVGAMENWGLVTYRERILLAYPGETSQAIKERITIVIAHETSHQWFGNLVTMKWWDDLWLNESFAIMMEHEATDAMFPDWHIWETFVMSDGLRALRRDATPGVQSVKSNVRHPTEINTLFDAAIVYAKGGRLLNMLRVYIGDDVFRKGLALYFKQHAYGNTSGADLWQALSEASGIDVAAFMNPWLERAGFPVISVDQTKGIVTLRQEHFLENGKTSDGRLWSVPLFANRPEVPKLLDKTTARVKLASGTPVVLNEHSSGHYIVNYVGTDHRKAILRLVETQELDTGDRLMLLNSASMLAKASYQTFGDVLQLLDAYKAEQAEPVWAIIALILSETKRFVDLDPALEPGIKTFAAKLTSDEFKRLGWQEKAGESAADSKLRATIIGLGAYAEVDAIIQEALRQFAAFMRDGASIAAELRSIVLSVAVKQKVAGVFDYLLNLHDQTPNGDLQADIMAGLTSTHDPSEASLLLDRLTDAKLVKPQDADYWLFYLLLNRHTRATAWNWMVAHWNWIHKTYANDMLYDDFPAFAAGACNTQEWADKYEAFFGPKRTEIELERNIGIGLTEIATRVAWLARDLKSVQTFFES